MVLFKLQQEVHIALLDSVLVGMALTTMEEWLVTTFQVLEHSQVALTRFLSTLLLILITQLYIPLKSCKELQAPFIKFKLKNSLKFQKFSKIMLL